jgi:hypothetical protein
MVNGRLRVDLLGPRKLPGRFPPIFATEALMILEIVIAAISSWRHRGHATLLTRFSRDHDRARTSISARSVKTSAWRRSFGAISGGWPEMFGATVTRTSRRCTPSTSERKSPLPEKHTISSTMSPLTLRRPLTSMNAVVALVTTV